MSQELLSTEVRSQHISVLGLRTRLLEAGPEERDEAVVCLHGAPGSANHWDDLLPRIGEFARAVAIDLPGYGACERPAHLDYSPTLYSIFMGAAINQLGIRRAHLVMNDIGGFGIIWAAANPDTFTTAVLINTGIWVGMRRWHAVGEMFRAPVLGALAERSGRIAFRQIIGFYSGLPRDIVLRWREDYDRGQRRAVHRMFRATPTTFGQSLIPVLRDLDRPALVIWGQRNRFIPVEQAQRQRESFPSAEVVILPKTGHYAHLENPAGVAEKILPFLRAHATAVHP
ncbi:MAG: alpha/beta hydrolase [Actinomycetota bacterium]|nr:alpha/beta hydrolase [Actinomycetota bacterium]